MGLRPANTGRHRFFYLPTRCPKWLFRLASCVLVCELQLRFDVCRLERGQLPDHAVRRQRQRDSRLQPLTSGMQLGLLAACLRRVGQRAHGDDHRAREPPSPQLSEFRHDGQPAQRDVLEPAPLNGRHRAARGRRQPEGLYHRLRWSHATRSRYGGLRCAAQQWRRQLWRHRWLHADRRRGRLLRAGAGLQHWDLVRRDHSFRRGKAARLHHVQRLQRRVQQPPHLDGVLG